MKKVELCGLSPIGVIDAVGRHFQNGPLTSLGRQHERGADRSAVQRPNLFQLGVFAGPFVNDPAKRLPRDFTRVVGHRLRVLSIVRLWDAKEIRSARHDF